MPAIGKDLSKIRSHLGLTIQDIQHYTKIPVETLKSIENGSIFDHPEENQTYIRSFVRSYGRALKIDDNILIKALDQNETGNYNYLLLQEYPELKPVIPDPPKQLQEEETQEEITDEQSPEAPDPAEEKPDYLRQGLKKKEPAEEPEKTPGEPEVTETTPPNNGASPQKTDTGPSVKSVDWADVGRKFSEEKKHTPVWIIGLIIILIIAAITGYFLYQNGFFNFSSLNQPNQQEEQVAAEDQATQSSVSLDFENSDSPSVNEENNETTQPSGPEPVVDLDNILELTVYAAYGNLGPVRIWTDMKPRMDPYWLEQGTAIHFEFSDTIRVRGSYPDLLLFKDGHLIENAAQEFLQQEENYIEITRDFFTTDEKWATAVDYELPEGVEPPDSIATRPTF